MSKNPAQQLVDYGQSAWYDNISRDLLSNGEIQRLISDWGVRGMTSNPSIFDNAIRNSSLYDEQIASLKNKNLKVEDVFEELALEDIAKAAELLLPVYKESNGLDGYISMEVSPLLARDAEATVLEAKKLFAKLSRPNIMIKIPGTKECIPAIEQCLELGININVTLLFSVQDYVEVAECYVRALTKRLEKGEDVSNVRSVASFFVSRVDALIDSKLDEIVASGDAEKSKEAQSLLGKFGIANSKIAYLEFQRIFSSEAFLKLKNAGALVQRPLWASTSTKNPEYRDVLYVEELIGENTVNTLPHKTLEAFVDHGNLSRTIEVGGDKALVVEKKVRALGIDVDGLLSHLQKEGVDKFIKSFEDLHSGLSAKL